MPGPEPVESSAVVALLEEEWKSLATLGEALGESEWDLETGCPGWSVKDQFSHVIGTERMLLGESAPPLGDMPSYVQNLIGELNEPWIAARRTVPGPRVAGELTEVTGRRLAQLRSFPAERFDVIGPSPIGNVPYREFMAVRVMDCWVHEQDVRVATGRSGPRDGPVADLAVDRLLSGVPFVVGKKAVPKEGETVVLEVTGPTPRQVALVVSGGRAVDAGNAPGTCSAGLRMDAEPFWRLTCGRVSAEEALDEYAVELFGEDLDLAARVLASMAFMP